MPTCRTCNKFAQHEVRTSDISLSTGWCSNGYPTDAWDDPPCHSDNDEHNESEASE